MPDGKKSIDGKKFHPETPLTTRIKLAPGLESNRPYGMMIWLDHRWRLSHWVWLNIQRVFSNTVLRGAVFQKLNPKTLHPHGPKLTITEVLQDNPNHPPWPV